MDPGPISLRFGDRLAEILLGTTCKEFRIDGISKGLVAHDKCLDRLAQGMSWKDLPDGPLRRAYAKTFEGDNGTDA